MASAFRSFAPLEVLVIAEAVGGPVIPHGVVVAGTVGDVTEGVRPAEGVLEEVAAFDKAAAGKADEVGRELCDHRTQVGTQAVTQVFPGVFGEQ